MTLGNLIPFRKQRQEELPARQEQENPLLRLQNEMNTLFDRFMPTSFGSWRGLMAPLGNDWDFMPDIDVRETKKAVTVTAELPGVDDKDLDVRLDGNTLTIRGQKRAEKTEQADGWKHSECSYGSFVRSVPLDAEVDPSRVEATFKNGVLKVKLPKTAARERDRSRIEVKAG